ncbi:hypothetical protein HYU18_02910 [Candidatus Woesearchaeota archaeon]|nr:hypothetical protein [Candidatus Woesearchaeota archaeon]
MRKEVCAVLLVVLVLAIAGCKGGDKGSVSSASTPFIGGTEGVRVGFLENAPPKETLDNPTGKPADNSEFDIALRVENVGEQDIPANTLKTTIGGIYPSDFNVGVGKPTTSLEKQLPFKLDGVKKDPEGGKITGGLDEVSFTRLAYIKSLEGNNEFPIQADVCYPYKTRAVADFCMRKDLTKATSGVCDVKGSKPVFSSGGPVQVTSFEEAVGGTQKVILKFKVKSSGAGTFYKTNTGAAACNRGRFSEEDYVKVTVNSGVAGLTCSGWGADLTKDVRLVNGEASVTCIQSGVNLDAVQKFNIQLDYNHLISASTKLLVKHLPTDGTGASGLSGSSSSSGSSGGSSSGSSSSSSSSGAGVQGACTEGALDDKCLTGAGGTGVRVCRSGAWSACVSPGGTPN